MPSKHEQRLSMLVASIADDGLPSGAEIDAEVERLAIALGLPQREPAPTWRYDGGKWIQIPARVPEGQRPMHDCDKCRKHAEGLLDWLQDDLAGVMQPQPIAPACWTTPAGEKH